MGEAIARHDGLLNAAIDAHDGYVFATGGDGLAAAFARAGDAVRAAVEAQAALFAERWPAGVSMSVRMGLHSGEADERENGFFGTAVNRAARIMSVARGGQILMSAVTASLAGGVPGVEMRPVGLAPSAGGERTRRRGRRSRRRRRPEHDPTACRCRRGQPAPAGDGVRGRSGRAAPPGGRPVGPAAGDIDGFRWGREDAHGDRDRLVEQRPVSGRACGWSSWPRWVSATRSPPRWRRR